LKVHPIFIPQVATSKPGALANGIHKQTFSSTAAINPMEPLDMEPQGISREAKRQSDPMFD
jgi:hypothetical protein